MFGRRFFDIKSKSNNPAIKHPPRVEASQDDKKDPPTVKLHVWETSIEGGVGHVAIEAGEQYASLWPDRIPSNGPTTVLPLPAALARSLPEDCLAEGAYYNSSKDMAPNPFIDVPEGSSSSSSTPIKLPDQTIVFSNLNVSAIQAEIKKQEQDIERGKTTYQLLPNIRPMEYFLRDGPGLIGQDPIDLMSWSQKQQSENADQPQVYNCATFAEHLLRTGGLPIKQQRWFPWGWTPQNLAAEASKLTEEGDNNSRLRV